MDGTVSGSNPIAALAQRMLDTSGLGSGAALGGASLGEQGGLAYYDAPPGAIGAMQQPWAFGGGDAGLEAAWSQQQGGMGMGMGMGMGGDPQMMMMQQMQMQMHHQHLMAMMHQRQMQEMAMVQQQQQQLRQQQEQQEQQQWEAAQSEKQKGEFERAIEATMNGDEPLTVERLEDIWQSFGVASEAQQELLGAAGSARQASYPEGASAEGYKEAWNKIAARLETPPAEVYTFAPENKYLSSSSASASASASASSLSSATDAATDASSAAEALRALLDRGHALFAAGCVSESVLAFEAAVQQDETCDEAWRMLGKCHAESDEDKKAILALQRAVDCDPYNLDSLLALGTSYVNELDSVRALETLKAWVKHNPTFSGFEAKADAYSDGSLMDEVTQLMLAAAEHSPQASEVQVVLGVLYNISLDYSNAVDHLSRALSLRAGGGYADKNKLGATLANANRSAEAVPLYVDALRLRPTFARGWLNLGISFANLNRYSDAAKAYIQALHLNPRAAHIWGYLRVVLTCLERLDLVERCGAGNRSLEATRQATTDLALELGLDLISEPSAPPM